MTRRGFAVPILAFGILMVSGCLAPEPVPTCDPAPPPGGEVDTKQTGVRWLDVAVPVPYSMQDNDLHFEATWTFSEGDVSQIRKLEYYGLSRSGYMGGDWTMIGPTGLQSNVVTVSFPTVSSVHQNARAKDIDDPVLHLFVMFSAGEPTMKLRGQWNGTDLTYRFGMDTVHVLHAQDFKRTSEDMTVVSASLPITNPERMVALVFDAEETAGILWRSPRYERPDGSSQSMKIPLLVEFSDLSGTWRFTMKAGVVLDQQQTVVWATLFDPARAHDPEC